MTITKFLYYEYRAVTYPAVCVMYREKIAGANQELRLPQLNGKIRVGSNAV